MYKVVDHRGFGAGALYILFGGAVAVTSSGYPLGSARSMGAGYFPLGVSLALVAIGIVLVLRALGRNAATTRLDRSYFRPMLSISLAVLVFAALLRPGGLILAVPAMVVVASFAGEVRSWPRVVATAGGLLVFTWLVFVLVLGLPLNFMPSAVGM